MDMAADTRARIVTAAGELFRRQGYAATGLAQIATASGAKIGSIYHFFAGKEALATEVIATSGAAYGAYVLGILADGPTDPAEALAYTFNRAADDLVACDYADACPIATLAAEVASTNDPLRQATSEVFGTWLDGLTLWCTQIVDSPAASDLATTILATLEGAFILCRARRDPEPLRAAGRSLATLASSTHETRAS
jgi:AcrR family transcriptional regulator